MANRQKSARARSIPAHAGEPTDRRGVPRQLEVYPRPRGGTGSCRSCSDAGWGLSPPTRGNLVSAIMSATSCGSIPAHAGEPAWRIHGWPVTGVYPRPRGGTRSALTTRSASSGLSPPTRGNHGWPRWDAVARGSIPAHAGEPRRRRRRPLWAGVYPRPRGGTIRGLIRAAADEGLSPPTRGNPIKRAIEAETGRSIPAHAGEPTCIPRKRRRIAVYPRPRGGTARRVTLW